MHLARLATDRSCSPNILTLAYLLLLLALVFPTTFAAVNQLQEQEVENSHMYVQLGPEALAQTDEHEDTILPHDDDKIAYEAEFLGIDRSVIGRAAGNEPVTLSNNVPNILNVVPGETNHYMFSFRLASQALAVHADGSEGVRIDQQQEELNTTTSEEAQLPRRQNTESMLATVFVSINTCLQPAFTFQTDGNDPPQLELYISNTSQNPNPGPTSRGDQVIIPLVEGFAGHALNATDTVYIGVSAPRKQVNDKSAWNYELAVSIDEPYHTYNVSGPSLSLVDSDPTAALLSTTNLTSLVTSNLVDRPPFPAAIEWLSHGPPLSIFVHTSNDTAINGLRHSYCGLTQKAEVAVTNLSPNMLGVQLGITTSQPGPAPEQQFYVPNLSNSTNYLGILAQSGNSTSAGPAVAGGGGTVFASMNFTTKRDANCAVVFNLSFCSSVAYAVPANPYRFNLSALSTLYDTQAQTTYQNFNWSLQQIPCNTTDASKYSLAKNCDDCAAAYKTWLCAVSIPRCADFSNGPTTLPISGEGDNDDHQPSSNNYLMTRNLAQAPLPGIDIPASVLTNTTLLSFIGTSSSRNNATITGTIKPGPYKEVLPCIDLCYELVRSCPAAMGFACPLAGRGLESSYGRMGHALDGSSTCSAPGVKWGVSRGVVMRVDWRVVVVVAVVVGLMVLGVP